MKYKLIITLFLACSSLMAQKVTDGDFRTIDAQSGLNIARGKTTGMSVVHKFGAASDFDAADGYVTVWDGAVDAPDIDAMQYTYCVTACVDSVISSSASDTGTVELQGLGGNGALVIQSATLNGQTRVGLATNLWRVFRIKNTGATNFAGDVSAYVTNAPTSGGIPTDTSLIRAHVQAGNNQTLMAIYTIPTNKTGYVTGVYASSAGANKANASIVRLFVRPQGGVFQLKHQASVIATGSSNIPRPFDIPLKVDGMSDIEVRANTDETGTGLSAWFDIILVDGIE